MLLEFSLSVVLAEMRLNVLGVYRTSEARVLLSSTSFSFIGLFRYLQFYFLTTHK